MKKIVLIGGAGHCRSCIDVIENATEEFEIIGIIDSKLTKGSLIFGYPVIGDDAELNQLNPKKVGVVICVGFTPNSTVFSKVWDSINKTQFSTPSIISKFSRVSKHSTIEDGCMIMHEVSVNSNSIIQKGSVLNTRALIEHDCTIGSFSHIAPSAVLLGNVKIGTNCFVGANTTIHPSTTISDHCTIGSNSLVIKSIEKPGNYFGSPVENKNSKGEGYVR